MTSLVYLQFKMKKESVAPSNHKLSYNPLSYIIDALLAAFK